MNKFETVIGLEIHVQLGTKSKAFAPDDITFGNESNTQTGIISLAHPGTLPKINTTQIDYAIRLGLAIDSKINRKNYFDRKNYSYPDLPKGYQITQDKEPICIGGEIPIFVKGEWKTIGIHHIHMEEDAGKSIHDQDPKYSLVDLNRAGTPLLEIVTNPDLRSADEVEALMSGIRQLVRYLKISDGNMQEGSLRCDVNISIRPFGQAEFGNRCEVKNLNSMKFARKAIEFEVNRQIKLVESGGEVQQQTLNFDPATGKTSTLRTKENANDYRYFPDPDLPPIIVSEQMLEAQKAKIPMLPWKAHEVFMKKFSLSSDNAIQLISDRATCEFANNLLKSSKSPKPVANLIIQKLKPWIFENEASFEDFPISNNQLIDFLSLIESGKVSTSVAYERLFPILIKNPNQPVEGLAQKEGLIQNSDSGELEEMIDEIIAQFPDKVKAYRNGKKGLLGFFMGQLMRSSNGKADPKIANKIMIEKLS